MKTKTETTGLRTTDHETATHTPGPWIVSFNRNTGTPAVEVWGRGGQMAVASNLGDGPEAVANARLIAAAPELLAALEECLAWFDLDPQRSHAIMAQDTEVGFRMIQAARAAIAKARPPQNLLQAAALYNGSHPGCIKVREAIAKAKA